MWPDARSLTLGLTRNLSDWSGASLPPEASTVLRDPCLPRTSASVSRGTSPPRAAVPAAPTVPFTPECSPIP